MPMNEVEARFKQWLDQKGYAYLFIEQSVSSFPSLFRGIAKRPDFLVMVKHFGMIEVDVKAGEINPISRVLECPLRRSSETEEPFMAVNPSDCIVIQSNRNDGLSRLME